MKKKKYYCSDMIMDYFYKQNKNKQIEVLFNALTLMQMCNGNSEIYYIAESLGFSEDYIDGSKVYIKN